MNAIWGGGNQWTLADVERINSNIQKEVAIVWNLIK